MKIAYLMNMYPMTSTTFIRREIHALEERGLSIKRYGIRKWTEELVDAGDIDEALKTSYLLSGNLPGLFKSALLECITNTKGVIKSLTTWATLIKNAGLGSSIHHVAYFLQAMQLRRLTDADGIDHLHVHFSTNSTAVAMLCNKMGGPKYSFTVHGPDEFDEARRSSVELKIANASFVAAISNFCKSQLIRYSSFKHWDKIKIIHCGISMNEFKMINKDFKNNSTFVCVGRLCSLKGQSLLPTAIKALKQDYPDVKVKLIGDGESKSDIESYITKHDLWNNFELLGWCSNEQVREEIASSRVLILPSFAEGLPVVFMESLALGTPVVATYIAGIPELVDSECGWIVPAGSEHGLIETMSEVLNTSSAKLSAMGVVGRQRIERSHNLTLIAEQLEKQFRM